MTFHNPPAEGRTKASTCSEPSTRSSEPLPELLSTISRFFRSDSPSKPFEKAVTSSTISLSYGGSSVVRGLDFIIGYCFRCGLCSRRNVTTAFTRREIFATLRNCSGCQGTRRQIYQEFSGAGNPKAIERVNLFFFARHRSKRKSAGKYQRFGLNLSVELGGQLERKRTVCKDADDGKFVTNSYAKRHKKSTFGSGCRWPT
jgi:hypothetical protein